MGDELLVAALAYAEIGWPVFPCKPAQKVPATAHGFKDATTDPATITAWWTRWPAANVAVATGAPGPDVLDVDTKKGRPGLELFDRVRRAGLLRGAAAIVRTPSGGLHVWFAGTDQPGGAVGDGKALELKACGGYVLLPPSYVDTGDYAGRYELVERREAAGTVNFSAIRRALAPARPPLGMTRPGRHADHRGLIDWVARLGEGNRNNGLFWAACTAMETGGGEIVLAALVDAAATAGLPDHEARRTVASARARVGARR